MKRASFFLILFVTGLVILNVQSRRRNSSILARQNTSISSTVSSIQSEDSQISDVTDKSTHRQTKIISIDKSGSGSINAFCLGPTGNIVAAIGDVPGEIRIIDVDGNKVASWEVAVKPEAVHSSSDGSIYVGGQGLLFKYSSTGEELLKAQSPLVEILQSNSASMRKEAIDYLKRQEMKSPAQLEEQVESYQSIIDQLEEKSAKDEASAQELQVLKSLTSQIEDLKQELAVAKESEGSNPQQKLSEAQITQTIDTLNKSRLRVASISTNEDSIYIATRGVEGYGYSVFKMDASFENAKEIISGLSGCCGQMDVQACSNGIYVAENSRMRVSRYNSSGREIVSWGKADRTGVNGFSSCCNPMNVCFNGAGEVLTAESGTGRIKRFSSNGDFMDFVGDVDLVPGCKNVSIAVTPDHSKVFMLDLTRNHILMLEKKPTTEETSTKVTSDVTTSSAEKVAVN
jgi:hypothetical protein